MRTKKGITTKHDGVFDKRIPSAICSEIFTYIPTDIYSATTVSRKILDENAEIFVYGKMMLIFIITNIREIDGVDDNFLIKFKYQYCIFPHDSNINDIFNGLINKNKEKVLQSIEIFFKIFSNYNIIDSDTTIIDTNISVTNILNCDTRNLSQ